MHDSVVTKTHPAQKSRLDKAVHIRTDKSAAPTATKDSQKEDSK